MTYTSSKIIAFVKREGVLKMLNIMQRSETQRNKGREKNGKKLLQQFHNYLTGFDMIDHHNRNPMDNRRCNLSKTTKKENNNNRTCECPGMKHAPSELEKIPVFDLFMIVLVVLGKHESNKTKKKRLFLFLSINTVIPKHVD